MKAKKTILAISVLLLIAVFAGCAAIAPAAGSDSASAASAGASTPSVSTGVAASPSPVKSAAAASSPAQQPAESASAKPSFSQAKADYSAYTGSWLCKAQTTSMELEVDAQGNVQGSITTVIGSHVPSSLVSGVIQDGVLTAQISSDDTIPGTLTISFADPDVLSATLTLEAHEDGFTLAEGEMTFERYTQE